MAIRIYTLGFTRKSAEDFFGRLSRAGVRRLVDVRLNNVSQLAGFAKRDDLRFFLKTLLGMDYVHRLDLAPTRAMLSAYREGRASETGTKAAWAGYEKAFLDLLAERRIEAGVPRDLLDGACLLCSEDSPGHCHRRLVVEYLRAKWGDVEIEHL